MERIYSDRIDALTLTSLGCSIDGNARGGRRGGGKSVVNGYSSGLSIIIFWFNMHQELWIEYLVYRRALAVRKIH